MNPLITNSKQIAGEKNHKCPTCGKLFRVRGDLKRHLKIHLRLIEKEQQTQKRKDDAEIIDSMAIYNKETLKPNVIYGDAVNGGDIFIETSDLMSEVAATTTNNNVENTSLRTPRKRKPKSNVKQKKSKTQDSGHHETLSVLQLPSTIGSVQDAENLVTPSIPVDINKMLQKQEKVESGITVSVSNEQYQIYLLEA